MLITEKAFARSIPLDERQVAHNTKTGFTPSGKEFVSLGPTVEADAETIPAERAIDFSKRRFQPSVVVIVGNTASFAR